MRIRSYLNAILRPVNNKLLSLDGRSTDIRYNLCQSEDACALLKFWRELSPTVPSLCVVDCRWTCLIQNVAYHLVRIRKGMKHFVGSKSRARQFLRLNSEKNTEKTKKHRIKFNCPFSSCLKPLFLSEAKCEAIEDMKKIFFFSCK